MPLQPTRDDNGELVPRDHEGIADGDRLIRRISEYHIIPDKKTGRRRISSIAYQGHAAIGKGMSVDIEKLIQEDGIDPASFVTTPKWFCCVFFEARFLRSEELAVGPLPEENNPYHGEVWGNFTDSRKRRLMKAAAWYVPCDGVDLF